MEILTWAEYKARSTDKGGFVLTHYSKLFNAAHCRVNIKGLNFQLGFDDRYFEKEWNNQVNQFKDSHLADFVEITAEVVREIKATLVNYESKLIEVNAMLATGLSGTDYNGAKSSQQHLEMMVNKYKRIVELLPSFEDVTSFEDSNDIKSNKPILMGTNMTHFNDHLKLHKLLGMDIAEGCKIKLFRESGQQDNATFKDGKWVDVLGDKIDFHNITDMFGEVLGDKVLYFRFDD